MKKIIGLLAAVMMFFTLQSCVTAAYAQVDDVYDDVDMAVVITYGTPYYTVEGLLMYYIYNNMYYYPYYSNGYHFHRYSRPLPPRMLRNYRPVPRDFYNKHRPHEFGHNRGHHERGVPNARPNRNGHKFTPNGMSKPNGNHNPNINRGGNVKPNGTFTPNRVGTVRPNGNVRPNVNRSGSIRSNNGVLRGNSNINRGIGRNTTPNINRWVGNRSVSPSINRGGGFQRGPSMPRSSTRGGGFGGRR